MENETKPSVIKRIAPIVLLVLVLAASAAVIIYSLDHYGVIDLFYEPRYIDIAYEDLGSAKKLEGRTAMVAIFASDSAGRWDFNEEESISRRGEFFDHTAIAAEWLTEQGKKYGKELEFCYPKDENDELLYYEHDFGDIRLYDWFTTVYFTKTAYNEWDFIEAAIDSDRIKETLGCDNIVYYFFLNYHEDNPSYALMMMAVHEPLEKPYEIVWDPYQTRQKLSDPIVIAHETLHLFGAPDLYAEKVNCGDYDVSQGFVDHCGLYRRTDIMYVTGGIHDRTRVFDRIDAEITDITAYYLGWTDSVPWQVDWYKAYHSQFDRPKEQT